MKKYAIVLAAGKGIRMKSDIPKCAYPLLKKPMINYCIDNINKSIVDETIIVLGYKKEMIEPLVKECKIAYQLEQLGTAHAVKMAMPFVKDGITIILPGDAPLLDDKIIDSIISEHIKKNNILTIGTMYQENPFGYGRLVKDQNKIIKIVEEKDANHNEKLIKIVNTGLIVANNDILKDALDKIKNNNAKNEYYLTDLVQILNNQQIGEFLIDGGDKLIGINDLLMLRNVESFLINQKNNELLLKGINIINPKTTTIAQDVLIDEGVTIYPGCIITGNTHIMKNAIIGPNTEIHNTKIMEGAECKHSVIYDSTIAKNALVGPFAHLRMNAFVGENDRIGNFVEIKNSKLGSHTNAAHLAYIGDTIAGDKVNFGCGSITVNYDGKSKNKTIIGNDVFVGCNVNLIAPIEIGDNAYLAAGSTLNKNVPSDALAIARPRQENKEGYAKKFKK